MQMLQFILFLPTMHSFQTGLCTLFQLYSLPKKTNLTENIYKKRGPLNSNNLKFSWQINSVTLSQAGSSLGWLNGE